MATLSNALDVCRLAYLEGLRVDLTSDGKPTIRGGTPSPELLVHLKEHRQAIIEHLKAHRIGERDPGYNSPLRRCYVVPGACMATKACARLGPCGHYLTRRPCGETAIAATHPLMESEVA